MTTIFFTHVLVQWGCVFRRRLPELPIRTANKDPEHVLIFACPPGVPRTRGLDLLWTDYREYCRWKGYGSTCLRFTPDRLHLTKTHIHINGQAADIRRLTGFCYTCAQATFNAENLESVWVLGCVGALHSLYEIMYSSGRYPHAPCTLPGN